MVRSHPTVDPGLLSGRAIGLGLAGRMMLPPPVPEKFWKGLRFALLLSIPIWGLLALLIWVLFW